jgi:hypothetical protein
MSRAAEIHRQKRQAILEKQGNAAVEEQIPTGHKTLPIQLNKQFNLSGSLHFKVSKSKFYKSIERNLDFNKTIDEIYNHVAHADLYSNEAKTEPSELTCILYKLLKMGVSSTQMKTLLNHYDSPYIRLAGALYLRLGVHHNELWNWLKNLVADYEPVFVGFQKQTLLPLGELTESLLGGNSYCAMHIPRIPIEAMKANLKLLEGYEDTRNRAKRNEPIRHLHTPNSVVDSMYSKDNLWYKAEIEEEGDDGQFWVSYTEFDVQEQRGLGFLELRYSAERNSRRGRSRADSRDDHHHEPAHKKQKR